MKLHIKANHTIWDMQQEFFGYFPFLKIEFFKPSRRRKNNLPATPLHPGSSLKNAYDGEPKEGILECIDQTTVAELEKLFKDKFNLTVQVFRKSGNLWLETTATDSWTLKAQNNHGKESTAFPKPDEITDYHLGRDTFD